MVAASDFSVPLSVRTGYGVHEAIQQAPGTLHLDKYGRGRECDPLPSSRSEGKT